MRYIRLKDIIYDASLFLREYTGWYFSERTKRYAFTESEIVKQADTIEDLILPGDIIFYYDFHSQSEQCMHVTNPIFLDLPITKLLIPAGDDYRCVAKADHEYKVLDHMKHVIKKGKLESIYKGA